MSLSHRKHVAPHTHVSSDIVGAYAPSVTRSPSTTPSGTFEYLTVSVNGTFENLLTLKDPDGSENYIENKVAMLHDPAYPDIFNPIFWTSEGIFAVKDIAVGGALMTASPASITFGATYTDCVDSDIGKQVLDDTVACGTLLSFNNTTKTWLVSSYYGTAIASGSSMTLYGGTGAGTTNATSVYGGGGAILMGHGFFSASDQPWIVLTDQSAGFDTLEIRKDTTDFANVRTAKYFVRDNSQTEDGLIKYDGVNNRIVFRNAADSGYILLDPNCYSASAGAHEATHRSGGADAIMGALHLDAIPTIPSSKTDFADQDLLTNSDVNHQTVNFGGFAQFNNDTRLAWVNTSIIEIQNSVGGAYTGSLNLANIYIAGNIMPLGAQGNIGIGTTLAFGSNPFTITSTTLISNLNADMLDGHHWSEIGGGGDMLKATYDIDNDGIVDNAEAVNGYTMNQNLNQTSDAIFNSVKGTASAGAVKAGDEATIAWDATYLYFTSHNKHLYIGTPNTKNVYIQRDTIIGGANLNINPADGYSPSLSLQQGGSTKAYFTYDDSVDNTKLAGNGALILIPQTDLVLYPASGYHARLYGGAHFIPETADAGYVGDSTYYWNRLYANKAYISGIETFGSFSTFRANGFENYGFLHSTLENPELYIGNAVAYRNCLVVGFDKTDAIAYMQLYGDPVYDGLAIASGGACYFGQGAFPIGDNQQNCGATGKRWAKMYAVQIGDASYKVTNAYITNLPSCPLPSPETALNKIRTIKDSKFNIEKERLEWQPEDLPEEMLMVSDEDGSVHPEAFRMIGFLLQTVRELTVENTTLEQRVTSLERR